MVNWKELSSIDQLSDLQAGSETKPVLIFKHSTRCGVSLSAKRQFEREWQSDNDTKVDCWYLDLLNHRDISAEITARYHVAHESPQVLLISNGQCIYNASHHYIDVASITSKLTA